MVEETKEQVIDSETKDQLGDMSMRQIQQITSMLKNYTAALNGGTINSTEMFLLGTNTLMAGWALISRSNDMDNLDVDTRIATIKAIKESVDNVLEKTYLNPEVVAGMVAKASMETLQRKGLAKNLKKKKDK